MGQRVRRSPTEWQNIIARLDCSELSVAEFSRREGIAYQSLIQWRSRFRAEAQASSELQANGFIEITDALAHAEPNASPWLLELELELGAGMVLRVARPS